MNVEHCNNIDSLRKLGGEWIDELHNDAYGLDVNIEVIKRDLQNWLETVEGVVLVAVEEEPIALFALFAVPSYMGFQKVALEKYWYARNGSHFAGPKLYLEAINWSREHGCSHLLTSASKMMPDRHDSICRFLEKTGAQHFETSYIYDLTEDP